MDSSLVMTQENLVIKEGNSQRHLPIWRDEQGREYVFLNPHASFSPVPLEQVKGTTHREPRP